MTIILTANVALAQKDSVLEALSLQKNILEIQKKDSIVLGQQIDSLQKITIDLENLDWLLATTLTYLDAYKDESTYRGVVIGLYIFTNDLRNEIANKFRRAFLLCDQDTAYDLEWHGLHQKYVALTSEGFSYNDSQDKKEVKILVGMTDNNDLKIKGYMYQADKSRDIVYEILKKQSSQLIRIEKSLDILQEKVLAK